MESLFYNTYLSRESVSNTRRFTKKLANYKRIGSGQESLAIDRIEKVALSLNLQ